MEANVSDYPDYIEPKIGKFLLLDVTGGTGGNAIMGFLEQGVTNLRAIRSLIKRSTGC
jgi:hypothetical protein